MFVRIVPTSILHRRPQVLGSIGATTIVTRGESDSNKHWILWTLLVIFVVGSIAVMMAADYLFAPDLINPATLPDAVGK